MFRYNIKMHKMHFEEEIVAKCVLTFYYKNILLKYNKQETVTQNIDMIRYNSQSP